jgi:hypothetical protein
MKLNTFIVLILCSFHTSLWAQKNACIKLNFNCLFYNLPLNLDSNYVLTNNDTISIETCRFYVSNIHLVNNNQTVFTDSTIAHLVDLADDQSLTIDLLYPENLKFDLVQFNLGIDSSLNVAEVLSGDLDPTKGMYWTWQSGYINFKIEGKSKKSPSRYKQFQYHLGGYLYPNNTLQTFSFITNKKSEFNFTIEIDKFLDGIDLSNMYQIMSPSSSSVLLSKKLAQLFKVK